jgi:hypothetical protein
MKWLDAWPNGQQSSMEAPSLYLDVYP